MDKNLEFFVKVKDLGSCFDLEKNCKKFNDLTSVVEYIDTELEFGWYFHFNGYDYRCFSLQYLVVDKNNCACGFLWLRLCCDNNKNE